MGLGEISLGEMGLGEMGLGEMGQNLSPSYDEGTGTFFLLFL